MNRILCNVKVKMKIKSDEIEQGWIEYLKIKTEQ